MIKTTVPALALSALALCNLPVHAQESQPRPERWYRVELLVFSDETGLGGAGEQWQPTPALEYPDAYRFLVDPQRVEANLSGLDADSELSARGIQTITIKSAEEIEEDSAALEETLPDAQAVDPVTGEALPDAGIAPGAPELPTTPTPFITLPRGELEFAGPAALMQRRGGRQTLFHEAWLQPVLERADAIPLVLDRSGDEQAWPRLQGSVLLHISRYLHIESNLWLNTPGSYLPGDWQMPAPPLGPASLVLIEPELEDNALESAEEDVPWYERDAGYSISEDEDPAALEEETGPRYTWRHAVLLDEKRRMRSNEVHYLDHPMLGIVIKLTPITEEELEVLALAEFEAESASGGQVPGNQGL